MSHIDVMIGAVNAVTMAATASWAVAVLAAAFHEGSTYASDAGTLVAFAAVVPIAAPMAFLLFFGSVSWNKK